MRRLVGSVTRGVSVAIVVVTLAVPVVYAAPREKDHDVIGQRIVRVIRHLISVVTGDLISDPKPTPPPTP